MRNLFLNLIKHHKLKIPLYGNGLPMGIFNVCYEKNNWDNLIQIYA